MRNDLALGKRLAEAHDGVVYPGHPDLPEVPRGSLDEARLPVVGAKRLVVITRDRKIRYRPVEKAHWLKHEIRGFVLTGRTSQSTHDSLAILSTHWPGIQDLADERLDGPWMFAVTADRMREIDLPA